MADARTLPSDEGLLSYVCRIATRRDGVITVGQLLSAKTCPCVGCVPKLVALHLWTRTSGHFFNHMDLCFAARLFRSSVGGGSPAFPCGRSKIIFMLYQKEGYTTPSTLGCRRPTGRPPLSSPQETCCMQVAVCIESICTIQTLSAHSVHSWVGFCILHRHCAFCTTLFLASPTYIGRVFAFCTCILHRYSVRSLLAVGEFLHSAFCILHPARLSQL